MKKFVIASVIILISFFSILKAGTIDQGDGIYGESGRSFIEQAISECVIRVCSNYAYVPCIVCCTDHQLYQVKCPDIDFQIP